MTSWNRHQASAPYLGPHAEPKPDTWPSLSVCLSPLFWLKAQRQAIVLNLLSRARSNSQKNKTLRAGLPPPPPKLRVDPWRWRCILEQRWPCAETRLIPSSDDRDRTSSDHLAEPEPDLGQDCLTGQTSSHLPQFFLCWLILMSIPLNTDMGVTRSLFHCGQPKLVGATGALKTLFTTLAHTVLKTTRQW